MGNPWHDEIGRFAPKGTGSRAAGPGSAGGDIPMKNPGGITMDTDGHYPYPTIEPTSETTAPLTDEERAITGDPVKVALRETRVFAGEDYDPSITADELVGEAADMGDAYDQLGDGVTQSPGQKRLAHRIRTGESYYPAHWDEDGNLIPDKFSTFFGDHPKAPNFYWKAADYQWAQ